HIVLPDHTIFIALDCSGAHFLSVALAVGALAGKFRGDGLRTRILILALAGALSMIFNWMRILLIVLAYLHPDLKHGLETIGHFTFGWWVFAFDLIVFYLVLRLVPSSAPRDKPHSTVVDEPAQIDARTGMALALGAGVLLPALSWALQRTHHYPSDVPQPVTISDAIGPISPDSRWQPHFKGAAWEHRVAYIWDHGRVVELYRNEYHRQSQGEELISHGSAIFDGDLFTARAQTVVDLGHDRASPLQANRLQLVDRSGREWLALYTHIIDGHPVAGPQRALFLTALHSLYQRPTAGILAVTMPCVPDCQSVSRDLDQALIRGHAAYQQARSNP
ncbi:MAG TPA: exosortase-associated EpsI family protein, partial [Povalibacter sp.]